MFKTPIILVFLLAASPLCFAQYDFAEITEPHGIDNARGLVVNDNFFLTYKTISGTAKSFWVLPNGASVDIDLKELNDKLICAVTGGPDSANFYFIEQSKKMFVLRSLVYNPTKGIKKQTSMEMKIPGRLLGSFVDGDVFLICVEKKE